MNAVHPRPVVALATAAAFAAGTLVALQSRLNGELGLRLGDGFLAALISFGGGFLLLTIGMLLRPAGRRGFREVRSALAERRIPWWLVLGGAAGAFLVLSQGLTAALLGVALFTVATVVGQTISAAVIDARGLGTMHPKPITVTRLAGSVLALAAVGWAVSARIDGDAPLWALVMPFVAGLGIGYQQAVNGQVRVVASSALTATFINFLVGSGVLAVLALGHALVVRPELTPPAEFWLYLGGPIGIVFIGGATIIVRITGVLLMGLATVAGQLVASVGLDLLAPSPGHEVAGSTILGTALTLVAVAIAAIPSRRLGRGVSPSGG
ncbi:DMT family transporter [Homoserinibacter sp. YIM 151385]|uniref:DMT family transporter n=1 Tax=Homoserinibacter sp. YIM 151385 TaxID=2985506 RepID=UPI0022F10C53|nr:DMT family transporter [Homoserinibacter sp. YIM 151385]WBU37848.1 DMT family transporter [Homoserinibacter sp. YIM 151385]